MGAVWSASRRRWSEESQAGSKVHGEGSIRVSSARTFALGCTSLEAP